MFKSSKFYTAIRSTGEIRVAIQVGRAPNPNDIDWNNLSVSFSTSVIRRVITFIITGILLGVSFGAMIGLKVGQYQMKQQYGANSDSISSLKVRIVSAAITIVIMLINFLISKSLRYLTFSERNPTQTLFFQSLTIKTVVVNSFKMEAQFINTNLIVVLIHLIINKDAKQAIWAQGIFP